MDVPFNIIDLTKNEGAMSLVKDLGYQAAPVVVAGEAHWSGFRPDKLNTLIS